MKFICDGLDLSNAVLVVGKALGVKKPTPVLEGIKITAKGDNLIVVATDGELTIEQKITADVHLEGEIVVPGKYFSDFIKKLESEQVEITLQSDARIEIKYGDNVTFMNTYNPEEYPRTDKDINENKIVVLQKNFKELIAKTVFAVSNENSRPILKGCLIEAEGNNLRSVALDGFRMAVCDKPLAEEAEKKFSAVVPGRTLNEIVRILDKDEEKLFVSLKKNALMVTVGNTTLISRLIEGEYLNYKQILPKEFLSEVTADKNQFAKSLDRVMVLSMAERMTLVKMEIKEKTITMTANSDIGNITENINVVLKGKDIAIAFNGKYISEYMRVCGDDFITLSFNQSIAPCVIKGVKDKDSLYLVLPVRINS